MDSSADRDRLVAQLTLLMDPAARELLDALPPYDESATMALSTRLRSEGHSPELIAAALTQSRLRARAATKFGPFADRMLLTPHGLEQASRLAVAAHHAQRFRTAGLGSVADLGCGIGGDALAFAGLGLDVVAVDADEVVAAVATLNLAPFPGARVELGTAEEFDLSRTEGVWLDPARRDARGRIHDPEAASPPLSFVLSLRGRVGGLGAKLSPAIDHAHLPDDAETEWVSDHGEVVEAVLWHGAVATPGVRRSALVLDAAGPHRLSDADREGGPGSGPAELEVGPVGRYVIEPDGAVLRAGLLDVVAARWGARQVDPTIAYLTADAPADDAFGRSFAVRDVLPFGLKALTAYLREHGLGVLEIKKRGTAVEPDELRRKLKPRRFGDGSATLILTRAAGQQVVIVADPMGRRI